METKRPVEYCTNSNESRQFLLSILFGATISDKKFET